MRVCLITATPGTVASGSGTFVAASQLVEGLGELGVEVDVVRPATGRNRHLFNLGLRPSDIPLGTDVVVGFDMDGWRLAGTGPRPFVAYLHGVIADEATFEKGFTWLRLQSYAWAERRVARKASLVLAPSDYSRRRITELYGVEPSRIRVVHPGTDVMRWETATSQTAEPPNRRTAGIFCVAHFYPRKNIGALLRATALLREKLPGLTVRIAGDGPEHNALMNEAERLQLLDTVKFLGHIPFAQLAHEYAACDVFCLPTLQEGFGLVFVEAMAAGKPIVALKAGAVPELVQDGINGLLAAPTDDADLATKLRQLLADAESQRKMSDANRARAREFTARKMAERFLAALKGLTLPSSLITLP